jgi:trigger factor
VETTIHKKSQVLRELEVFVDEQELNSVLDKALRDIRPRLTLPGFRPGKAPLNVVKKLHGDAIEGDALEKLAQDKFQIIVEEQKLEPIGRPVMTDLHRHAGEGAHFRISYEVKPEITVQDFDGVEVEKPIFEITDKEVDERVHYLRFGHAVREDATKIEDKETIVTLTFQELDPNENGEQEPPHTTEVYLYDPQVVDKLREELLGKSQGDTFQMLLPKQTPDATSKDVNVEITIDKVVKLTLPEMTEEFCKKLSRDKAATELEVRALVREELIETAKRNSDQILESNMVEALLKRHEFEVPRTVTYAIIDQSIQEAREQNRQKGYPEDYGIDVEEYRKGAWTQAEVRAKWLLLRDKIVEAESIHATEEDIDAAAAKDAEQYGIKKENLLEYYKKADEVKERIKSEKLVEVLKKKFVVKETIPAAQTA